MAFKFENLAFPKDELFVLTSQTKRATDSISLNIAEGKVVGCIFLAKKRNLLSTDEFNFYYMKLTELIKGIQALRNSLK